MVTFNNYKPILRDFMLKPVANKLMYIQQYQFTSQHFWNFSYEVCVDSGFEPFEILADADSLDAGALTDASTAVHRDRSQSWEQRKSTLLFHSGLRQASVGDISTCSGVNPSDKKNGNCHVVC